MTSVLLNPKRKERERKPVTPMIKEEVARHGKEGWFGGGGDIVYLRLEELRESVWVSSYMLTRNIIEI
jgi:hypothetical protein